MTDRRVIVAPQPATRGSFKRPPDSWLSRFRSSSRVRTTASLVAACAIWEIQGHVINNQFLPPLSTIGATALTLFRSGTFWPPLVQTGAVLAITTVLSVVLGGLLGFAMGFSRSLDSVLGPALDTFGAIPAVAFVPLWIVWFGPTESVVIPFTLVLSIPPMALNTRSGLWGTDSKLIEMARSFSASPVQIFRFVSMPASLPLLLSGVRLTLGRCLIGVIIAEELLTGTGLGGLLLTFGGAFSGDQLWALTLLILIISYLIWVLSDFLNRQLLGWREEQVREIE
jgi:ABC-type nitrate/sulfonate/bicarbonate transport system permease component